MSELLELAKRNDPSLDDAFTRAAQSDPSAAPPLRDELLATLAWLAGHGRVEQAEMLAWTWLTDARGRLSPDAALDLARRLLAIVPESAQLRGDLLELCRQAHGDREDIETWLNATGLAGSKVSTQRATRALDLLLGLQPGQVLVERSSTHTADLSAHRLVEAVRLDPSADAAVIRPLGGGERQVDALRLGDDYAPLDPDDFRVLARRDPQRLKAMLADEPLAVLISMIRAAGDQLDTDQLKDNLVERVLTAGEYSKWWSRARAAAKKSPHVRIEGRSPTVLVYDQAGTTLEEETAAVLARTWGASARLAVVEGYLRAKSAEKTAPDPDFLATVAQRVGKWLAAPDAGLADALAARRLTELGVPVADPDARRAEQLLADLADPVQPIAVLDDAALWTVALALLPSARPVGPAGPGPDDWQAVYLRLLPYAPGPAADAIAAALLDAGQVERLNAELIAVVESPLDSINALCWLWTGPAASDRLDMPRTKELLDCLLDLSKQAQTIAATDARLARDVRAKVRAALSDKGLARFREHVGSLEAVLAPMLRRQIRRAEGLGVTLPEQMLAVLDEVHPPVFEPRKQIDPWLREDVIYASAEALAGREKELEHITHVEMPANARAIGAAAAHGDLSENSEYKFALEERDLLRARAARIQNELAIARVLHPGEVPHDHVSIYSKVKLAPTDGGEPVTIQIVSPWDSDVAERRYNYKAPLSLQVLGKRPGEQVRLSLDGGPERDFRIDALLPPD